MKRENQSTVPAPRTLPDGSIDGSRTFRDAGSSSNGSLCRHELLRQRGDGGALQSERKVPGIPQDRHLEKEKPMHVGDRVLPLRETVDIPHLPEEAAQQGREGVPDRPSPVALPDPGEDMASAADPVEGYQEEK